jgi:UDP-N-acetylglucosamine acyltransferase
LLTVTKIHPTASVHPNAQLGEGVEIGPFCVVEDGTVIGDGTILEANVSIIKGTRLGKQNHIFNGAVIGGAPQHRAVPPDIESYVEIGDRNVLREFVTIHRATHEGSATKIGDDCYIMAYCHIGHDGHLGNRITMANSVGLSGHITVEDLVTFGGMVGVHQFARIGKGAMVGGMASISRDVPPFTIVVNRDEVLDINAVGLRRIGLGPQERLALHKAIKLLFKSELGLTNAIATVRKEIPLTEEVEYLLAFEERRFRGKNGRGDQP